MKKLLIIPVLLFAGIVNAQPEPINKNPDGDVSSLHFSIFKNSGTISYSGPTSQYKEVTISGSMAFAIKFKIPLGDSFTIAPFVDYNNYTYPVYDSNINTEMKLYKFGTTMSIYFNF